MQDYSTLNDAELTTLLCQADRSAYAEIYKRYRGLLYVYACKIFKDEDEAEDVVQEIFIYLWKRKETLLLNSKLSLYLYGAVRHKFFNKLDHEKVRATYRASLSAFIDSGAYTTDDLLREKELIFLIEKEVLLLPAKMREVFELSRKGYLSHKEIAERLNISDKTVKKQMNNAIKILKAKLGPFFSLLMVNL
ncbi:ECF RNA polymerase sigma factor SigW [compost metagenome]